MHAPGVPRRVLQAHAHHRAGYQNQPIIGMISRDESTHNRDNVQAICKNCSRVLLPEGERVKFVRKLMSTKLDALAKSSLFKKIIDLCKKVRMYMYVCMDVWQKHAVICKCKCALNSTYVVCHLNVQTKTHSTLDLAITAQTYTLILHILLLHILYYYYILYT